MKSIAEMSPVMVGDALEEVFRNTLHVLENNSLAGLVRNKTIEDEQNIPIAGIEEMQQQRVYSMAQILVNRGLDLSVLARGCQKEFGAVGEYLYQFLVTRDIGREIAGIFAEYMLYRGVELSDESRDRNLKCNRYLAFSGILDIYNAAERYACLPEGMAHMIRQSKAQYIAWWGNIVLQR